MYEFVTHTWNAIKGKCPHDCSYCYMKIFPQGKIRLDKRALQIDLGENNFIFVGSSCDVFADEVPEEWIFKVLAHCVKYGKNKYLFQSKNPKRMFKYRNYIPPGSIIGTTIETNRFYSKLMGNTLRPSTRAEYMRDLSKVRDFKTMVTIEPIMDFDLNELSALISRCNPSWVNIGADSKGHSLPEPSKSKILDLIISLKGFTKVKMKKNLKRLGRFV